MEQEKQIIIVAGEASGDMHAAHLVEKIKTLDPQIKIAGFGGPQLQAKGVEIYQDLTKIAVVGFFEVLKHYPLFKKAFNLILKKIKTTKPSAVILVDYPGFNLRLAKEIRKIKGLNTKIIYYISPQVWAWKQKRVADIKKYVDEMLVLFEFEKTFYKRFNVNATFVGHPLLELMDVNLKKEEYLKTTKLQEYKLTIGLLPGSRKKEVERHLPIMLETIEVLNKEFPMLQFLIIQAPTIETEFIESLLPQNTRHLALVPQSYNAINACDLCMVASGTATLEVAILGKPMVVIYKTSLLTFALAKWLIKIPYIAMVNVIAERKIVPECVQHQARPSVIAKELKAIFTDEIKIAEIKSDLGEVKKSLGDGGASERAARAILKTISTT